MLSSIVTALLALGTVSASPVARHDHQSKHTPYQVSYDARPFYLVNNMTNGPLKDQLIQCENGPFSVTGASIGHRGGGTLFFPEETVESTMAGARMGAGILECDVAFTKDRGLVCRHSLCDLHTTTNILLHPELASKCTRPFTPANATSPASALCCTSDITTTEYLTLCGKQDGFNASATTIEATQYGTPVWRSELYDTCGTLMTLDSYITLVDSFPGHRNFTPELKQPPAQVPMPFNGYTQEQYARDMLDKFIERGIAPERVWAQSFNPLDIYQWIAEYPAFAPQLVFLEEDGDDAASLKTDIGRLGDLAAKGVKIISPPWGYLLTSYDNVTIVPSPYAAAAKAAGLDIIAWTFERSGPLATVAAREEYYYTQIEGVMGLVDGDEYVILDLLFNKIGIKGLFSDWSSTVSYFANCFGIEYYAGI